MTWEIIGPNLPPLRIHADTMTLREIVYKIHADKLHVIDLLSGGTVTIDLLAPDAMRTVERFLHCEVVRLEAAGQDVRILVL